MTDLLLPQPIIIAADVIAKRTGRPPIPDAQRLRPTTIRLSDAQKATLKRVGDQALRDWLDGLPE